MLCRFFCIALVVIFYISIATPTALASESESNDKLDQVKQAISKQKAVISQTSKKRQQLEQELKQDDLAIAKVAKTIALTQKQQQQVQQKLTQLSQQKTQLTRKKQQQENILAQQLRAAYSSGHHDYLKLMLNQEQPAKVQRTVTYYQYLNKARTKEIDNFQQTLGNLLKVTTAHQEQVEQLQSIKEQQQAHASQLKQIKSKRTKTLTVLGRELLTKKQQLAKLEAEEQNLVAALKKMTELAQVEVEMNGLGKLKRKLLWPVTGKIIHRFGTRKQGYLKWKGVLMSAPVGKQVKTIHSGTVLFADWLKGYGLVTVVDHGKGYMSLYGHNQALLKSVGERVETGEPIALVGQSGGQQESGLYFEIRHKGKAVNPKLWCR